MFRSSLRSVSDPFRDNVCFSCLAIRLEGQVQTRAFRSTRLSRAEAGNGDSEVKPDESPAQGVRPPLHKKPKTRPPLRETKSATWSPRTDNAAKDKPKHLRNSVVNKIRAIRSDHDRVKAREPGSKPLVKKKGVENNLKNLIQQIKTPRDSQPLDQKYSVFPPLPGIFTSSATGRRRDKLYLARQNFKELNVPTQPVPNLAYGLQRVLFNPGVYHLRDPRSHVFNFDPYLGSIMPVTEFDFAALKDYITSSRDEILRTEAIKSNKKYIGSSSSMTSVLSHFHYLLSAWRPINTDALSRGFDDDAKNFTRIMRAPAAMILRYKDGVYAIDADKEFDSANILMNLGKSMEKLLTLPKDEFERYRRSHQNKITPEEEASLPESYHYSTMGDFLMRSQLDAHDPRLPGTGMFDLKTRAVISIRMDARNFEAGLGYQIKSRFGKYESYEREYFDMIRAAFLKYSLQVRIGRMDGIFVAFHNIERIFGFQYISLSEMDQAIHGQTDTALGDGEFRLSLQLWNKVLNRATEKYPGKSLRFHFETRDTTTPFMYIFYEPVTDEEIESIQTRNKAEIDAYQQRILKYAPNADGRDPAQEDQEPEVAAAEDEAIADTQEPEVAAAKNEVIEDTPPKSEDLADTGASSKTDSDNRELSGMVLMALNRVNGRPVGRPYDITEDDSWSVEYELTDLEGPKVKSFYNACQHRRKTLLEGKDDFSGETAYLKKLRRLAYEGRKLRKAQDKYDRKNGVTVLDGVEH